MKEQPEQQEAKEFSADKHRVMTFLQKLIPDDIICGDATVTFSDNGAIIITIDNKDHPDLDNYIIKKENKDAAVIVELEVDYPFGNLEPEDIKKDLLKGEDQIGYHYDYKIKAIEVIK